MNSSNPMVSVIIPTYNRSDLISETIQSVLNQIYQNLELIIVDDGSTDHTKEIVNSFKDPRIQYIYTENWGGPARPRNIGIKHAKGEYIAFLDSDDTWYPTKLNRCIEELTNDRDLVCHNLRYIRNGKYWKDVKCGPAKRASFNNLLYSGNCLAPSAVVVRKACLLRVAGFSEDPKVISSEDYDLWLKLSKERVRFHFIDEILGEYHVHESSISKAVLRHMHSALSVIEKHVASTGKVNIWEHLKLRRKKALLFYGAARSYQQKGQKTEALRFYWKSVLTFPFILRTYAGIALNLFP
jgi:glycosyltransferase involved in cell wall biosynthesis